MYILRGERDFNPPDVKLLETAVRDIDKNPEMQLSRCFDDST